jgi:diamine N-acetyltransferase
MLHFVQHDNGSAKQFIACTRTHTGGAMELSIRSATIADYDGVALIFDEVDSLHRQALPHVFRAVAGCALEWDYFEAALDAPEADWLLAERAGEIIGFANVRIQHAPDRPALVSRRFVEVDSLGVRADHQHAGIGRALMARVTDWAAAHGIDELQLNVWEFNRNAIGFYEALGYVAERRTMRRIISNVNS